MRGPGRLVKHMLDVRVIERSVQLSQPRLQPGRLLGADANPEQMYALGKGGRIGERAVEGCLWVEFLVAEHHRAGSTAETADVREELEVIEGHLEGLHAAHRQSGHGAM